MPEQYKSKNKYVYLKDDWVDIEHIIDRLYEEENYGVSREDFKEAILIYFKSIRAALSQDCLPEVSIRHLGTFMPTIASLKKAIRRIEHAIPLQEADGRIEAVKVNKYNLARYKNKLAILVSEVEDNVIKDFNKILNYSIDNK